VLHKARICTGGTSMTVSRRHDLRADEDSTFRSRLLHACLLTGTALSVLCIGAANVAASDLRLPQLPIFMRSHVAAPHASPPSATHYFNVSRHVAGSDTQATSVDRGEFSFAEEYRRSWFLGKINAADAHELGYTGNGVLVAVVDS